VSDDNGAEERALRALATDYAVAADQRDGALYSQLFLPNGYMRVRRVDDPAKALTELRGHGELSQVPAMLAKAYDRTYHFVGQARYEIGLSHASGLVYCQAHHLSLGRHAATSHIMNIRYEDHYKRSEQGVWRIAARTAWIDWTETRVVDSPAQD
jgi:hypothetical protein